MRRGLLLALLAAAIAAVGASVASAGSPSSRVDGGGVVSLQGETDEFGVGASIDANGSNPRGTLVVRALGSPDGNYHTYHGDVSQGCVLVNGNTALVVGLLPASEQYTVPGFGTVAYDALYVVDNGNPSRGQPADLVTTVLLKPSSAQHVCGGAAFSVGPYPMDHGNVIVSDAGA